jgi:hypothetical protein
MELTARKGRSQYAERPSGLKIAGELKASSAPDVDASGQPAAGMFDCERSRKEPKHLLRVGHTHVDRGYWNPTLGITGVPTTALIRPYKLMAPLRRHLIFLVFTRTTTLSASSSSGRCTSFASSHGARIQTSRASSLRGARMAPLSSVHRCMSRFVARPRGPYQPPQ